MMDGMKNTGKMIIVGSYITDVSVYTAQFPTEGETVLGSSVRTGPGGKGSNQATAAHRAGAQAVMIARIGDDSMASTCHTHYEREGMTMRYIIKDSLHPTGTAVIEVSTATAQNKIIVVSGANAYLTAEDVRKAESEFESAAVVLTQLESSLESVCEASRLARKYGAISVLNPAPAPNKDDIDGNMRDMIASFDYITPNESEAERLTGVQVVDDDSAAAAADILHSMGVPNVIITLGSRGSFASTTDFVGVVPAFNVRAVDTTGAGDSYNGALCAALSRGDDVRDAISFATAAAAISVTRQGASEAMASISEIQDFLKGLS